MDGPTTIAMNKTMSNNTKDTKYKDYTLAQATGRQDELQPLDKGYYYQQKLFKF